MHVFIELIRCLHAYYNIETATADVCEYSQFYSGKFGSTSRIIPLELICSEGIGRLKISNFIVVKKWIFLCRSVTSNLSNMKKNQLFSKGQECKQI